MALKPTAETDAAYRRMMEKLNETYRKRYAAKQKRAKAKTVRKGKQAKRQASRSPGGYQAGGGTMKKFNDPTRAVLLSSATGKKLSRKKATPASERKRARTKRGGGGWAEGGTIETYNAQVQRKYHGGKI